MASPEIKFIPNCRRYTAPQGNEPKLAHIHIHIHKKIDVGYQPKIVVAFCFSGKGIAAHTGDPFWELVCVTKIPKLKNKPKFS